MGSAKETFDNEKDTRSAPAQAGARDDRPRRSRIVRTGLHHRAGILLPRQCRRPCLAASRGPDRRRIGGAAVPRLIFDVVSDRYERGSIVLTTNLPFEE